MKNMAQALIFLTLAINTYGYWLIQAGSTANKIDSQSLRKQIQKDLVQIEKEIRNLEKLRKKTDKQIYKIKPYARKIDNILYYEIKIWNLVINELNQELFWIGGNSKNRQDRSRNAGLWQTGPYTKHIRSLYEYHEKQIDEASYVDQFSENKKVTKVYTQIKGVFGNSFKKALQITQRRNEFLTSNEDTIVITLNAIEAEEERSSQRTQNARGQVRTSAKVVDLSGFKKAILIDLETVGKEKQRLWKLRQKIGNQTRKIKHKSKKDVAESIGKIAWKEWEIWSLLGDELEKELQWVEHILINDTSPRQRFMFTLTWQAEQHSTFLKSLYQTKGEQQKYDDYVMQNLGDRTIEQIYKSVEESQGSGFKKALSICARKREYVDAFLRENGKMSIDETLAHIQKTRENRNRLTRDREYQRQLALHDSKKELGALVLLSVALSFSDDGFEGLNNLLRKQCEAIGGEFKKPIGEYSLGNCIVP